MTIPPEISVALTSLAVAGITFLIGLMSVVQNRQKAAGIAYEQQIEANARQSEADARDRAIEAKTREMINEQYQKQTAQITALRDEMTVLQVDFTRDKTRLTEELKQARKERDNLDQELKRVTQELNVVRDDLHTEKALNKQLRDSLEAQRRDLQSQIRTRDNRIAELEAQLLDK